MLDPGLVLVLDVQCSLFVLAFFFRKMGLLFLEISISMTFRFGCEQIAECVRRRAWATQGIARWVIVAKMTKTADRALAPAVVR